MTSNKTPHIIGPTGDLLTVSPKVAPYMFPMLGVDLSECTSLLKGRLMFIYAELSEDSATDGRAEGLAFRVDDEGRYTLDEKSTSELSRFINEVELPTAPSPKKWKGKYLELKETPFSNDAFSDLCEMRSAIRKLEEESNLFIDHPVFGGTPLWMQSSKACPLDPDGNPMLFIGQMTASYVTNYAARPAQRAKPRWQVEGAG